VQIVLDKLGADFCPLDLAWQLPAVRISSGPYMHRNNRRASTSAHGDDDGRNCSKIKKNQKIFTNTLAVFRRSA
jgi:hypothetical protein